MTVSSQFATRVVAPKEPITGREFYAAVWRGAGHDHVVIGAASMEALQHVWLRFTGSHLDPETAQHLIAVKPREASS